jgi:CheY-like chemotaxis protein
MTANAFKEDIERCLESGMNDHLPKPINHIAVIGKIMHYLNKTGANPG